MTKSQVHHNTPQLQIHVPGIFLCIAFIHINMAWTPEGGNKANPTKAGWCTQFFSWKEEEEEPQAADIGSLFSWSIAIYHGAHVYI